MRIRTDDDERLLITETPWFAYVVGYGGLLGGLLAAFDLWLGGHGDPRAPWILLGVALPVLVLLDRVVRIELNKRKSILQIHARHLWHSTHRQIPFREVRAVVVAHDEDRSFGVRNMQRLIIRCRKAPDFQFATGALRPARGLEDIANALRLAMGLRI